MFILQQASVSPTASFSPVQAFPPADVQLANHNPHNSSHGLSADMSSEEAHGLSADDRRLSDVVSSDNDDNLNSAGLSEGSNWDYYQVTASTNHNCLFYIFSPLC